MAWGQPASALVTIIAVAAMCCSVLLTSGRTVASQQEVLASLDAIGTRSIVVRAEPAAGLESDVVDRLRRIEGIEWVAAMGPATDAENASFAGGAKVPLRLLWAWDTQPLHVDSPGVFPNESVWLSDAAAVALGIPAPSGALKTAAGVEYPVVGTALVPDYLAFLEPLAVVPQEDDNGAVAILIVVAEKPELVPAVTSATTSMLGVGDPSTITVNTSESLALLRETLGSQLADSGRLLTLIIFALTGLLTATVQLGLVVLRRKEFGRRRAIGASQRLIVSLIVSQTALLSSLGSVVGVTSSLVVLAVLGNPLPSASYSVGIAVLAIAIGAMSAVAPAAVASRRDPIKELRVP